MLQPDAPEARRVQSRPPQKPLAAGITGTKRPSPSTEVERQAMESGQDDDPQSDASAETLTRAS